MTSNTDPDQHHLAAWEAIPWVLNGQASAAQAVLVEQHVPHCESCQQEWERQRDLQQAMQQAPAVQLDTEEGLKRLLARVDLDDLSAPLPAAPPSQPPTAHYRSPWWGGAMAASVLVTLLGLNVTSSSRPEAQPHYQTLSEASAIGLPPAAQGSIRLALLPETTLAQWDALLRSEKLQVVGGPNAVGAYTVAVPPQGALSDILQRLRQRPEVLLAEPIQDPH